MIFGERNEKRGETRTQRSKQRIDKGRKNEEEWSWNENWRKRES